jgi:tripartite-type tricarboxylate transporter receptor subunit TctC
MRVIFAMVHAVPRLRHDSKQPFGPKAGLALRRPASYRGRQVELEDIMRRSFVGILFALFALSTQPARADAVAEFYRGRTVDLIVGYSVGGGYDTYARILARHIGKHIPGNPTIVVKNMPGAGSLKAAQFIYDVALKDGATFGTFGRGLAMEPLIGASKPGYDSTKFTWLGSGTNESSVLTAWHTSGIKTWNDMLSKSFTVGGEGSGSDPDIYAALLKNLFGARLKLITGYPGTSEIALAMERGEVDARASWSWSSLKSTKPDWISGKKVNFPVQLNLSKNPELPDVPLIMEFATNDRQRQILTLVLSRQTMGRPFAAPPGIPPDRKQALRSAFDRTMKDPEFLAEAKARAQEVNPVDGAALDRLIGDLYRTPQDILAEARTAITEGTR